MSIKSQSIDKLTSGKRLGATHYRVIGPPNISAVVKTCIMKRAPDKSFSIDEALQKFQNGDESVSEICPPCSDACGCSVRLTFL
jgi:hypothetical protein